MSGISRRELLKRGAVGAAAAGLPAILAGPALGASSKSSASMDSLVVLMPTVAEGADWDGSQNSASSAQELICQTYRGLLKLDRKEANGVLVPQLEGYANDLAESVTQKGLVWTFKLRQGIKSAVGNELTSADVVWTFERANQVGGAVPCAWFLGNVAGVLKADVFAKGADKKLKGSVVALDRYTVQITQYETNEVWPDVLSVFCLFIVDTVEAKKHITAADPWAFKYLDSKGTAGFGPYSLAKWTKSTEVILKANPNYTDPVPQFKKVTIRAVPASSSRIASLLNGSADVITGLAPEEYDSIRKGGKAKVLSYQGPTFLQLGLNYKIEPWGGGGDPAKARLIRQAVAFAMPYDQIAKVAYYGQARKWESFGNTGYYGAKQYPGRYTTNIAKAKALLAQAGFPGGKGLAGEGLKISFIAERRTTFEPVANFIRTALAQIGMNVALDPVPNAQFADRYSSKRDMAMYLDENLSIVADTGYMAQVFWVPKEAGGLLDSGNWPSKDMIKFYNLQKSSLGKKRLGYLAKMQDVMMSELPGIPIAEVNTLVAVRKDLTDWAPRLERAMTMEYWKTV